MYLYINYVSTILLIKQVDHKKIHKLPPTIMLYARTIKRE